MIESNEIMLGEVSYKKIIAAIVETDKLMCLKVGFRGVEEIQYHEPVGDGDAHFIDVIGTDDKLGRVRVRYLNVKSIAFEEEGENGSN